MGKTNTEKNKRYASVKRKNLGLCPDILQAAQHLVFPQELAEMLTLNGGNSEAKQRVK